MKADAVSILAIFEKKLRLEVPLFQRQYVWNQERQWGPLWDDISRYIKKSINPLIKDGEIKEVNGKITLTSN